MGKVVESVVSLFDGGSEAPSYEAPPMPDYEGERKKAEEESLKKRQATAQKGMGSTILGGSTGDNALLGQKKLLGE